MDGALDQHTQDGVRVHADRPGHIDRLSEDVQRVRPASGDALDPADQHINGWVWTVWHDPSMADAGAMAQERLWSNYDAGPFPYHAVGANLSSTT